MKSYTLRPDTFTLNFNVLFQVPFQVPPRYPSYKWTTHILNSSGSSNYITTAIVKGCPDDDQILPMLLRRMRAPHYLHVENALLPLTPMDATTDAVAVNSLKVRAFTVLGIIIFVYYI